MKHLRQYRLETVPTPMPAAGELLIKVQACVFPLEQWEEGFKIADEGSGIKVILIP